MPRAQQGLLCAIGVLLIWIVAAPAHAITNVYALQETVGASGGTLLQYGVGPGGALSPLAPTAIGGPPRDIAVTPDGRFAYVMTSTIAPTGATATSTIIPFARGPGGRLEPNGAAIGPLPDSSRGIIVNPQGTRVYYGRPGNAILVRNIDADGTLGAESAFSLAPVEPLFTPYAQFLAMTPDGRNLYAAQFEGRTGLIVWQSTIDPSTGLGTPKSPASVGFPAAEGTVAPDTVGRMAVTPSGGHLYVTAETVGVGIGRWAIDPATGTLVGGTPEAPPSDGYAEASVAVSVTGAALWAPSAGGFVSAPERVRRFAIGAGGALAPLAPPAVNYVVAGAARDLIASPDGASLYLAQPGTVGEWSVGVGGTLTHRANSPAGPDPALANQGIALAPSQAPNASFTALAGPAGRASLFDGRASVDPDGTVARYDWNFGDGTSAPNGGPIVSHAYATPGTRAVTLTVTDADGTSTAQLWTGTRMLRNGSPAAQETRDIAIAATARPRKGKSVTVRAVGGRVLVRVPGSSRYVAIEQLTEIPLGSIIDARKGKAQITAEVNATTGRTQSSIFYDWYFKILQTKGAKPITEARMTKGSFASCTPSRLSRAGFSARSRKRSRKKIRQLWGNGRGEFRTGGKRSSATVRGTQWLVEDRCDGTLTRVKKGRVDVRVFATKKTVRLWKRAGRRHIYLAKAP